MDRNHETGLSRRGLFRVGAGAATAAVATSAASPSHAQESFDYDGWFEDANNFDGTVDMTGEEQVTVEVGVGDISLAFGPSAIHVDPGTTVRFEWTGEGGGHNVAERETGERYESDRTAEAGTQYELTFESDGISKYVCVPHASSGMKGAVVVGNGEGVPDVTEGETLVGGPEESGEGSSGEGSSDGGDEDGGDGEVPPALQVDDSVFALFGLSAVLAFLSPLALVALLRRDDAESDR